MAFTDYTWHKTPWQQLQSMREQNRIPHALLITGIRGLAKKVFADRLIASLLCQQPDQSFQACGQCHSCQLLAAGSHPDHTVVSPEEDGKQIKVDQIRTLKASQTLMPKVSDGKTVLITHADQMNISAFNSLLKLLEEPQPNSVLVLLSENSQQLPITIKSRCQTLILPVPSEDEALQWLKTSDVELEDNDWRALLKLTQGAPLEALAIHRQGLEQSRRIHQDIAVLMKGRANPVQLAASWQQFDLKSVLYQIQSMMQAKITALLVNDASVSPSIIREYWSIADCITHTIKLISSQNNPNKTLLIEDFMVTVTQHADQIRRLQGTNR